MNGKKEEGGKGKRENEVGKGEGNKENRWGRGLKRKCEWGKRE